MYQDCLVVFTHPPKYSRHVLKGIHYVGRAANIVIWVPFVMLVIVFWANKGGIAHYVPPHNQPVLGFLSVLTITIGYFATGGAAGADFGMSNRNRKDVFWGGFFGIVGGVVIAGGLDILAVAGYLGRHGGPVSYEFSAAIASVGTIAPIMFYLFAAATIIPSCFASFLSSNSFNTMFPKLPRAACTFGALTVSAILAVTGVANNLVGFFGIVGASFGPICGAMAADYLLAGKRWSGPRNGINWAGYLAWALGFLVGIPNVIPGLPASWVKADNPAVLYSFIVGFVVYLVLAKVGLLPAVTSGGVSVQSAGYQTATD